MERERLTRLVEEPGLVGRGDLSDLHALAERFPWFAGAQVLRSVGEHKAGDVLSEETLRVSAAHIPSRAVLFDLVHEASPAHSLTVVPKVEATITAPLASIVEVVPEVASEDLPKPSPVEEMQPQIPVLEKALAPVVTLEEVEEEVSVNTEPDPLERQFREAAFASSYDLSLLPELPQVSEVGTEKVLEEAPSVQSTPTPIVHPDTDPLVKPSKQPNIRKGDRLRFTDWLEAPAEPLSPARPDLMPNAELPSGATDWLRTEPQPEIEEPVVPSVPTQASVLKEPVATKDLIDRFIKQQAPVAPPKTEFYTPQQAAKRSLDDSAGLVTETLARVYEKQGDLPKAIEAYHRLALNKPEKSAYFAALAKELEGQLNK